MSDEDFLSRWSRRKRGAKSEPERGEGLPIAPLAGPEARAPGEESEPEITPEEIAALPKIEELTAQTDIAAFLRKGVPEILRNAALRRVWSLDPAIRDYVSEAREYAYDWNVPGGVPGNGPLLPTDDVEGMLARIFGGSSPGDSAPQGEAAQERRPEVHADLHMRQEETFPDAAQHEGENRNVAEHAAAPSGEASLEETGGGEIGSAASPTDEGRIPTPSRRRHGGATPV